MKKALLLVLVVLLAGCSAVTIAPEENMANYSVYLSTVNSEYFGAYENVGHVEGYSYGYVGNRSDLIGFYMGFKLPSDFPKDGDKIGDYEVDHDELTKVTLRLPEVNKGTRGNALLTLKVAAITGAWNADAAWNTIPALGAIVDSAVIDNAAPSSNNYNPGTRYGYHAAQYKYKCVFSYDDNYTVGNYYYYTTDYGLHHTIGNGWAIMDYISTIPAYYEDYYLYHDIDITNVIKDAIENGATGMLLYFDYANDTTYDKKVFTTPHETADSRRPALILTFEDGSGTQISCKGVYNEATVTPGGFKGVYNGAIVNVGGIKGVKTINGVKTLVDVYRP